MEKKKPEGDVYLDPSEEDEQFQAELLEEQHKTIKKDSPALGALMDRFKNSHKESED